MGWGGAEGLSKCLSVFGCSLVNLCVTSVSAAVDVRMCVPVKVLEHTGRKKPSGLGIR